jgi:hypothetical protein
MTPADRLQRIADHQAEIRARVAIRREQTSRIRELRRILKAYGEGNNGKA